MRRRRWRQRHTRNSNAIERSRNWRRRLGRNVYVCEIIGGSTMRCSDGIARKCRPELGAFNGRVHRRRQARGKAGNNMFGLQHFSGFCDLFVLILVFSNTQFECLNARFFFVGSYSYVCILCIICNSFSIFAVDDCDFVCVYSAYRKSCVLRENVYSRKTNYIDQLYERCW